MSVYVDWRSNPDDIRSDLSEMGTFPTAFSWDWYADFVGDITLDWDATNDTMSLLEEIGEHCLEIGFALISLELDADGYDLTMIDCAGSDGASGQTVPRAPQTGFGEEHAEANPAGQGDRRCAIDGPAARQLNGVDAAGGLFDIYAVGRRAW